MLRIFPRIPQPPAAARCAIVPARWVLSDIPGTACELRRTAFAARCATAVGVWADIPFSLVKYSCLTASSSQTCSVCLSPIADAITLWKGLFVGRGKGENFSWSGVKKRDLLRASGTETQTCRREFWPDSGPEKPVFGLWFSIFAIFSDTNFGLFLSMF